MIVDTVVDEPNVANYLFREQEGSFLMGVLAGRLTETEFSAGAGSTDPDSTTGFVGGVDSPVIRRFQAGFEAGVDYASDNVDVTTSYVGSYADPSGGGRRPHCRCTKMGWISSITLRARRASACSRPHRRKAGSRSVSTRTSRSPTSRSRT